MSEPRYPDGYKEPKAPESWPLWIKQFDAWLARHGGQAQREDNFLHGMAICLALAAGAVFLGSLLVLGSQCLDFLKTGTWTSRPTGAAFNTDTLDSFVVLMKDWVGVLKIFLWVLDQPLTLSLAVLGIAFAISSAWTENSRH